MSENHFAGRGVAIKRLHEVMTGQLAAGGNLTIQSIEGPGGIGKSFLFNHAIATTDLSNRNYITLRVDGSDQSRNLVSALQALIKSADADALLNKPTGIFFPQVDVVVKAIETIKSEVGAEFKELNPGDNDCLQSFLWLFDKALAVGKGLSDLIPFIERNINIDKLQKYRDKLETSIPMIDSLRVEGLNFLEKFGLFSKDRALRNSIRENACRPLADALVSDLSAILKKYRNEDTGKATHKKLKGIDRLLLIIDDFEMLQEPLGEFLVGHFLPELRTANFESVVFILGRDQLEATHPGWGQHLNMNLLRRIDLSPLSKPEMDQLVESYGVVSDVEKERAWNDTQGYPFYVQLWIEEVESGGQGGLMLKRFYDRTTRWMRPVEKEWLHHVLFLDKVNIRILGYMLGDKYSPEEVQNWFEGEGSIRDTSGKGFRVREYIRSRLIEYISERDPDLYLSLQHKAQLAMQASIGDKT